MRKTEINKMKNNVWVVLFALLFTLTGFSQNKQWSLEACVSYALENNISIKQAQNNILSNDSSSKIV